MDQTRLTPSPRRDLVLFVCGPALVAAAIAVLFAVNPWPMPVAGQAQEFTLGPVATSLALGALGVWLSSRVGLPSAPALTDARRWGWILLASAGLGVVLVAATAILDRTMGLERVGAQAIGQTTINVPFPASIAHYICGGILQESLFRVGPIPILAWITGTLFFRDGAKPAVWWVAAVALSLIEPVVQASFIVQARPDLALISASVGVVGNIAWVVLYRRFGWPVLIIVRIVVELGWHVVWPQLGA